MSTQSGVVKDRHSDNRTRRKLTSIGVFVIGWWTVWGARGVVVALKDKARQSTTVETASVNSDGPPPDVEITRGGVPVDDRGRIAWQWGRSLGFRG